MTAMTEITRSGSKAARGLVSVQSRYNQIIDESSSTGKKLSAWYKEHNIQIKDQNGQLRSFYEVGSDVAKIWDDLSDNERKYYLNAQAGANQSQNLASLMRNYQTAIDATNTALNSNNSAEKENQKYKQSLKGSLQDLKSAWEDFSRKVVDSGMITKVLTTLTKAVNFLASDIGQATLKWVAFATAGAGAVKVIKPLFKLLSGFTMAEGIASLFGIGGKAAAGAEAGGAISKLISKLKGMKGASAGVSSTSKAFVEAGGAINGATAEASAFSTVMSNVVQVIKTPVGAAGLMGAIASLSAIMAELIPIGSQVEEKLASDEYEQNASEVEKLTTKYKKLSDEKKKLLQKQEQGTLTDDEKTRLAILEAQTNELAKQLQLKREQTRSSWEESQKTIDYKSDLYGTSKWESARKSNPTASDKELSQSLGIYTKLDAKVVKYTDSQQKAAQAQREYNKAVRAYTKEPTAKNYDKVTQSQKKLKKANKQTTDSLSDLRKMQKKWLKEYNNDPKNMPKDMKKSYKAAKKLTDAYDDLTKGIKNDNVVWKKTGKLTTEAQNNFKTLGSVIGVTVDKADNISKVDVSQFSKGIKDMGGTAQDAMKYLEGIEKANPDVKFNLDGAEVAIQDLEVVDGMLQEKAPTKEAKVEVIGKDELDELNKSIEKFKPKTAKVKADVSGKESVDNLKSSISKLKDKTVNITVNKTTVEKKNGTRHFAKGTTFAPSNAEVNEQGFEIIQSPSGLMRVANGGKRGPTLVEEGSAIYTHGQSMRMLHKAGLSEGELLSGKRNGGDVGVYGVGKLEGFKKGLNQKQYNKKVKKLREEYDNKMSALDDKRAAGNWSDEKYYQEVEKLEKKYQAKFDKLATKRSNKKKIKAKGFTKSELAEYQDIIDEKVIDEIEEYIDGMVGTLADLDAVNKMIQDADENLTEEERKELMKDAVDSTMDYLDDLLDDAAIDTEEYLAKVEEFYKEGMLTAKEYYEYVRDAREKANELLEEQWEAQLEAEELAREAEEERRELEEEQEQARIDLEEELREAVEEAAEAYHDSVLEQLDENQSLFESQKYTYEQMLENIQKYYDEATISAEEYYDYLNQLAEAQVSREQTQADRQWDYLSQYISRQIELESEENELLEAKNDLLEAQSKKVKVYVEGQGLVYQQDNDAVKEAEENLKSYTSVWEELQDMMSEAETLTSLKNAGLLAGSDLVSLVTGTSSSDTSTWGNLISVLAANKGSYDLANELGITDPNQISTTSFAGGQMFNISNVNLPNVTNANTFIDELTNLANKAIQSSSSRT